MTGAFPPLPPTASAWAARPRATAGGAPAIVAGSGPQVLLLHGVGLRAEAWGAQIDAFSGTARVVAPDMAGHGAASRLERPDLTAFVDYAGEWLDTPSVIVGHSMGAMLALALALARPDRVLGVAALNAVYRRAAPAQSAVRARAAALDGASSVDPTGPIARWFDDDQDVCALACARWLRAMEPQGYRDAYTVFATHDGPDDLHQLSCPSLFMTGVDDPNSTPEMSAAMANTAGGESRAVAGAAHMMPMTHATEINADLARFFDLCLTP